MQMYTGIIAIALALWFGAMSFLALRLRGIPRYMPHLILILAGVMAVVGIISFMDA